MFDNYNFKPLFDRLKKSSEIHNNVILQSTLSEIEKYSNSNKEKVFMLGHFVKSNSVGLSDETKADILKEIRNSKLERYFSFKTDNHDNIGFMSFVYIFSFGGILLVIAGVIQLIRGDISYGLSFKYLLPIIKEGGSLVIFGLIVFIGGLIRIKHERRKKKFIAFLATEILHSKTKAEQKQATV
jgi:hypothetical protein